MNLSTETAAQCARLLAYMREFGPVSTTEARELLGVLHPAGRVHDLRRQGVPIVTTWGRIADVAGVVHRQARYVLAIDGGQCDA